MSTRSKVTLMGVGTSGWGPLVLGSCEPNRAVYRVEHQTPGEYGSLLEEDLFVERDLDSGSCCATLTLISQSKPDTVLAMVDLARKFRRIAEALEAVQAETSIGFPNLGKVIHEDDVLPVPAEEDEDEGCDGTGCGLCPADEGDGDGVEGEN